MASEIRPSIQTDARPPVSVKGTKEGLLFLCDEQSTFEALALHLTTLLTGETSAVFDGPAILVSVDYGSRTLSAEETRTLLSLFLDKPNFVLLEWGPDTAAKRALARSRTRMLSQALYKGTVRAGQRIHFDGDVVIIGDVNPGGEVISNGDIYVFGRLMGIAHAGAGGNRSAIIAAAEFRPMQLRIHDIVSRAPEVDGRSLQTFMEFAYLSDEGMAVDKFKYLPSVRRVAATE